MREKKTQKTTRTSKGYEKLLQERLKRESVGSPYKAEISLGNLVVFFKMMKAFRKHYKIGDTSFKGMVLLYDKWINKRDGMSLHELALGVYLESDANDKVDVGSYEKCRQFLNRLISLGLVEMVALRTTVGGRLTRIFAPTVKMLREFGAFARQFSEEAVVEARAAS